MPLKDAILPAAITLTEEEADRLQNPPDIHVVEVRPPRGNLPATLDRFTEGVREYQTKSFKLRNISPIITYETRRINGELSLQYAVPTKRQERKIYAHLEDNLPGAEFDTGHAGLPVTEGTTIGGAVLRPHRSDWHPLRTEFNTPPTNALASTLDQSAMQGTDVIIQIAIKPNAGRSLKRWWWQRRAGKAQASLNDHKVELGQERSPSRREKQNANTLDYKRYIPRFQTTIAVLVINAGEHTQSHVKEITGAYNRYRSPETGQALDTVPVRHLRRSIFTDFADAIRRHDLSPWARPFQTSLDEVAALVALPDRDQENLRRARP